MHQWCLYCYYGNNKFKCSETETIEKPTINDYCEATGPFWGAEELNGNRNQTKWDTVHILNQDIDLLLLLNNAAILNRNSLGIMQNNVIMNTAGHIVRKVYWHIQYTTFTWTASMYHMSKELQHMCLHCINDVCVILCIDVFTHKRFIHCPHVNMNSVNYRFSLKIDSPWNKYLIDARCKIII